MSGLLAPKLRGLRSCPVTLRLVQRAGTGMLIALRTGLSFRLAATLAAFAVLCLIAPPAVVAFGHGEHTVHCLAHADMVEHGAAKGSSVDKHANHSAPADSHQMTCCGLFFLTALPAEIGGVIDRIGTGPGLSPATEAHILSQAPERPARPPISLLFV
jgi:hypothetical protein